MGRRQQHIRRQSWVEKAQEAPQNIWYTWLEDFESLDWDLIQRRSSWPLAIALNAFLMLIKISVLLEQPPESTSGSILRDSNNNRRAAKYRTASTFIEKEYRDQMSLYSTLYSFGFWRSVLLYIIFAISIGNMVYLFSRTRSYQLLYADPAFPALVIVREAVNHTDMASNIAG
ncbi:hypothetical protein BJ085DRAFT_27141 [Dimargaris cristalligena]|uniref:Uncharacterized protein n=1 Tax=Dimargaris cristalligena TaxID=215637 RepID=A0A4P9ZQP0_9FUNG|nr:hypothetical protein BJ085DRAFT_27141 [Dimargaris cristalligena]|eukprot:RKP35806.1 hypothetical protein BJ085DRAFT_27141 [Dimargaris cristalligena]